MKFKPNHNCPYYSARRKKRLKAASTGLHKYKLNTGISNLPHQKTTIIHLGGPFLGQAWCNAADYKIQSSRLLWSLQPSQSFDLTWTSSETWFGLNPQGRKLSLFHNRLLYAKYSNVSCVDNNRHSNEESVTTVQGHAKECRSRVRCKHTSLGRILCVNDDE